MTPTSTTTNSVFQAFIEAQHALEQLPAVEAELASLKGENETIHRAWDEAELKAMSLEDELKAVKADLAAREEALKAATFREQEAASKLQVILSVIGPVPQPQPVVDSHSVVEPKSDAGESAADPTADGTAQSAERSPVSASTHPADFQNDASSTNNHPEASPAGTSGEGDVQNQDGNGSQSQTAEITSAGPQDTAIHSSNERLPYWRKPADQSWSDWTAAGNEPAPWLHEDHTDPHAIATK